VAHRNSWFGTGSTETRAPLRRRADAPCSGVQEIEHHNDDHAEPAALPHPTFGARASDIPQMLEIAPDPATTLQRAVASAGLAPPRLSAVLLVGVRRASRSSGSSSVKTRGVDVITKGRLGAPFPARAGRRCRPVLPPAWCHLSIRPLTWSGGSVGRTTG
jgi:hypothetical protein